MPAINGSRRFSKVMTIRSGFVSVAMAMAFLLVSSAFAGKLEKEAIEVGPGVEPPKLRAEERTPHLASVSGTVTLRLLIDQKGYVQKSTVVTATDPSLERPATDFVSGAKFSPALRGDVPVAVWWTESVQFVSPAQELAALQGCDTSSFPVFPPVGIDAAADAIVISRVDPVITKAIRESGNGGATFDCVVDVCGRVTECAVAKSSGPTYTESAKAAAIQWRFRPLTLGGHRVPFHYTIRIDFRFGS